MTGTASPTIGRWHVAAWVCGAVAVSVARLLHPIRAGHDIGYQILAAQNLLAGAGLTIFEHSSAVLNDPPTQVTLTHYPAGYSLGVAAFLGAGFDEPFAIKALGSIATIFGWLGWGRLVEDYLADGFRTYRWLRPVAVGMAILTPLLFTLPWAGTDIFLWAIVPWVVHWLIAGDRKPWGWSDCGVGVLVSVAVLMRYAGVFLLVFSAALILLQAWNRPTILLRRLAAVAVGAAPCLFVQMWIISSASGAAPGGVSLAQTSADLLDRLLFSLSLLPTAHQMWTFWLPGRFTLVLLDVTAPWRWTLGLFVVALGALVFLFRKSSVQDRRTAALGLFVALPAVLLAAMLLSPYGYVGDRRYYGPVVPLAVLVASWVAVSRHSGSRMLAAVFRVPAGAYAVVYVIAVVGYALLMLTPTTVGATQRVKLLGDHVLQWPLLAEGHSLSPSRQLVGRMIREQPGAILLSSRLLVYLWDPKVDRTKLHRLTCSWSTPKRIRGPAEVILMTFDRGDATDLWNLSGAESGDAVQAEDCLEKLPDLTMVQRFPDEGLKVLRARIAAGDEYIIRR